MLSNTLQFIFLCLFGLTIVLHLPQRLLPTGLPLHWITSGLKLEIGFPATSAIRQGPGSLLITNQQPAFSQVLVLISFSAETSRKHCAHISCTQYIFRKMRKAIKIIWFDTFFLYKKKLKPREAKWLSPNYIPQHTDMICLNVYFLPCRDCDLFILKFQHVAQYQICSENSIKVWR